MRAEFYRSRLAKNTADATDAAISRKAVIAHEERTKYYEEEAAAWEQEIKTLERSRAVKTALEAFVKAYDDSRGKHDEEQAYSLWRLLHKDDVITLAREALGVAEQ